MGVYQYVLPAQDWELGAVAASGMSLSQVRFAVSLLVSVLVSALYPIIPTTRARHAYAVATGFGLIFYPFGAGVLHALAPSAAVYVAMAVARRRCGALAWAIAFPYLIANHVMQASGLSWKAGALDFTGAQMLLTLKLVAAAVCYQDGAAAFTAAAAAEKKDGGGGPDGGGTREPSGYAAAHALRALPSPLEWASYLFGAGNLLAGPFVEARDYLDCAARAPGSVWDPAAARPAPRGLAPGAARFAKSLACAAVWFAASARFPPSLLEDEARFLKHPSALHRWALCYAVVVAYRFKYYFVWALAEAQTILTGVCFEGWEERPAGHHGHHGGHHRPAAPAGGAPPRAPRARWTRCANSCVRGVELGASLADKPRHWNSATGRWLRHYVYERLRAARARRAAAKNGGAAAGAARGAAAPHAAARAASALPELLATQLVSGVWHGLFPGYWLFFGTSAFMFEASKVLYRYERGWPPRVSRHPAWTAAKAVMTAAVLDYAGTAFIVLTWDGAWAVWRALGYAGHAWVAALLAAGALAPPRRRRPAEPEAAAGAAPPAEPKKEL